MTSRHRVLTAIAAFWLGTVATADAQQKLTITIVTQPFGTQPQFTKVDQPILRELLERLFRLPHVDYPDSVVGLGSPVEDGSRRDVSGLKAHQLDDLVVLFEGRALEVHLDRDWHRVSFFRLRGTDYAT